MPLKQIRIAFEKRLYNLDTGFETSVENVSFDATAGTPYQYIRLIPSTPQNPTLGDSFYREVGVCAITLCYPTNQGSGTAADKAEELRVWFKRGTSMEQDGTTVTVNRTPTIGTAYIKDDRYCVPVRIEYYANEW